MRFINKFLVFAVLLAVVVSIHPASAQTPAPVTPTAPLESAWTVSVNGNFSSLQNQGTNNGVLISTAIRLATHWNLRADTYILNSPNITIVLGGPEYRLSLARLFKNSTGAVNAQNVEAFINTGLGDAHSSTILAQSAGTVTTTSTSKFAYAVGGGFDIKITDNLVMRPLDVKYIRSSMIGGSNGTFVGNHLDFAAGLGLHF